MRAARDSLVALSSGQVTPRRRQFGTSSKERSAVITASQLSAAEEALGVKKLEDWYHVTHEQLGIPISSVAHVVKKCYPEHKWSMRLFKRLPKEFWTAQSKQLRTTMDWLGSELGVTKLEDWYSKHMNDVSALAGSSLSMHHKGSISALLKSAYPEHEWQEWRFASLPRGFWDDEKNCRSFIEWLSRELNITALEDWYKVTRQDINSVQGRARFTKGDSGRITKILMIAYPNHEWQEWRMALRSQHFFEDSQTRKNFVAWAANTLRIQKLEDWYSIKGSQLSGLLGAPVRLPEFLRESYPTHEWVPWLFRTVSPGFWTSAQNRVDFAKWVERELNISTLDQWYNIEKKQLDAIGASRTVNSVWDNSLPKFLKSVYPSHYWQEWRFAHSVQRLWNNQESQKKFVEWAAKQLKVKTLNDWYAVERQAIEAIGGDRLLDLHRSKEELLRSVYPDHEWESWRFS